MLWPTTEGRVVSANLVIRRTAGENSTTYRVLDGRYAYAAGGAEHHGARDFMADKTLGDRQTRYVEGATMPVHYDPDHPAKSLLEPTAKVTSSIALLCWIFGVIVLVMGIAMLFSTGKPGMVDAMREALAAAGVKATVEVLPGSHHGYALPGRETYDRASALTAWENAFGLFGRVLGGVGGPSS